MSLTPQRHIIYLNSVHVRSQALVCFKILQLLLSAQCCKIQYNFSKILSVQKTKQCLEIWEYNRASLSYNFTIPVYLFSFHFTTTVSNQSWPSVEVSVVAEIQGPDWWSWEIMAVTGKSGFNTIIMGYYFFCPTWRNIHPTTRSPVLNKLRLHEIYW